jgi:aminomuconate-semialdehyde/2-hydroxymuconate-6-semialdehyde dehydrogenase
MQFFYEIDTFVRKKKMITIQNYINGVLTPSISGETIPNYAPRNGVVFSSIPNSNEKDVALAVASAQNAFPTWKKTSAEDRCKILTKIADLIAFHQEKLVHAESLDNGKPISVSSHVDIPRAESNMRFFASGAQHFASESHVMENGTVNYTYRKPLGVVGCISPWNLPLYLFTWKIAPALAAGNCVVAKPSELTPYTAFLFSEICIEAGLPAGVLNIVHGTGTNVGEAMVQHTGIKAISFTGGTATGKRIASILAPQFKKMSLELGGKNATIVFPDADIEKTASAISRAAFANQGQICLCGSRIFIHESIYEVLKTKLIEKVAKMKVMDPLLPESKFGALVSQSHLDKVLSYIQLAKEEGGNILCGGSVPAMSDDLVNGYYLQPTLIDGLNHMCRTNQEEIFGPVATIIPFQTEEEVIDWANSTPYGLAASIWTQDISRAHRVAHQLETGICWINTWLNRDLRTPFGGVKQSGLGREGGWDAFRFFTEPQNICIDPSY